MAVSILDQPYRIDATPLKRKSIRVKSNMLLLFVRKKKLTQLAQLVGPSKFLPWTRPGVVAHISCQSSPFWRFIKMDS